MYDNRKSFSSFVRTCLTDFIFTAGEKKTQRTFVLYMLEVRQWNSRVLLYTVYMSQETEWREK